MDVGGQFSGTVTGVMNMTGAFAASLTALVYGGLFDRGHWVAPFFVSAGVLFLGALIWIFLIHPERSLVECPQGVPVHERKRIFTRTNAPLLCVARLLTNLTVS